MAGPTGVTVSENRKGMPETRELTNIERITTTRRDIARESDEGDIAVTCASSSDQVASATKAIGHHGMFEVTNSNIDLFDDTVLRVLSTSCSRI